MTYFCDYCNKKMTEMHRKAHNDGLIHKIAYANYWFDKRPLDEILQVESSKKCCPFFFKKGKCKFDAYCQSTHYTKEQLKKIKELCNSFEYSVKKSIIFENEKQIKKIKNKGVKALKKFYTNRNIQKFIPSLSRNNYILNKSTESEKYFEWNL